MTEAYWIIEYEMKLLSDFHVGAGVSLMGGNLHGLRLDEFGFPYLPQTQVRGLMRLRGCSLISWQPTMRPTFERNFGLSDRNSGLFWSYTRAGFPREKTKGWCGAREAGLLYEQSHIHWNDQNIADNLFSYQKAGAPLSNWNWQGRIYSVEPAAEKDVAFLIAAMRADDRIGHRRSRGYGKVDWRASKVMRYSPGGDPENRVTNLDYYFDVLFQSSKEVKK